MNALVEDQMVRLRRALDSPEARAWYAAHTDGEPFFFGRYTGVPVPGTRAHASDARRAAEGVDAEGAGRRQRVLARLLLATWTPRPDTSCRPWMVRR